VKTYYVYMLLCSDDSFYVGVTSNIEMRIAQHEYGIDPHCYTFTRRPVRVVHVSDFHHVDDAIAVEKKLKGWTRAKKRALVAADWRRVCELAVCRNETIAIASGGSPFDSAQGDKVLRRE
jgi:putative endonuclease